MNGSLQAGGSICTKSVHKWCQSHFILWNLFCFVRKLYIINKRGVGFCDWDEGFSYNIEDDKCYKEQTQGPCKKGETWLRALKTLKTGWKVFGKCEMNKCEVGFIECVRACAHTSNIFLWLQYKWLHWYLCMYCMYCIYCIYCTYCTYLVYCTCTVLS